MNGFSMNSPDNKRFRSMMSGGNGTVDQRMLMGGGGWGVGGGAQLLQPYAHQDALMELARENLMLKHQLQAAVIESSQLRLMCEKFQRDADEDSSDACKSSQSRYWSDDEHCRFLEAIQKCGHKDVKSIAAYVGTRNTTQVRTHAQKYFMRLARSSKQGDLQGCRSEQSEKKLDCKNDPSNYMHAQSHNAQHAPVQDARSHSKSAAPLQQSQQPSQHAHHHQHQHHQHQPQQPPQHHHHLQQQMSADGACFKKRVDAVRVEAVKGATSEVLIRVQNRLEGPERPENGGSEEGCSGYSECSQGKQSNADFGQSPQSHAHDSTGEASDGASDKTTSVTYSYARQPAFELKGSNADFSGRGSKEGSENEFFDAVEEEGLDEVLHAAERVCAEQTRHYPQQTAWKTDKKREFFGT